MLPADRREGGMSKTYNVLFLCTGKRLREIGRTRDSEPAIA